MDSLLRTVYIDKFVPLKLRACKPGTHRHYLLSLRSFNTFLDREATLTDLNDLTVSSWLDWFAKGGKRNNVTINQKRQFLIAFWRWCHKKNFVTEWPDVAILPEINKVPSAWSKEELKRLFDSCKQEVGIYDGIERCDWWLAMHYFLWDTGERTGATLRIRMEWVDWQTGTIAVCGSVRKTPKSMVYRLAPDTMELLHAIREPERDLLFPFLGCICTLYSHYTKILIRAGLPAGRGNKLQKMRRSFASHLENAGGDATEALEHSSRSITKKSYLDPRKIEKPAPFNLLFRPEGDDHKTEVAND